MKELNVFHEKRIIELIKREMNLQFNRYGNRHNGLYTWITILMKQIGKIAEIGLLLESEKPIMKYYEFLEKRIISSITVLIQLYFEV